MSIKKKSLRSKVENVEETNGSALLDLPDLALDCILEKLDPNELCKMAEVCESLRDRCRSDYLWERHMKTKWGRVIGQAAYREWELHNILMTDSSQTKKKKGFIKSLSCVCSISWGTPKENKGRKSRNSLPVDSIMSFYLRLESGKFWFPAQVYNREDGHVGFMLSCYDAQLSYDCFTDTFQARYPPHGPRPPIVEDNVQWDRIRAPANDNPPRKLYDSGCLEDLHPGDHIEIQWRRNKEFPYGWWYGVVGHLDTCDKIQNFCCCHKSDSVVLEFNQYSLGSRWRTTIISRKDHREQGSEADGFYGGIRKLYSKEQISVWKNLWPKEILQ
ncbi:F-box protein [Thalictrum thalictroides]|uniref:F-box protein n=1 Tax=Thalictrum thalictroides TaxID=46969 RepID=A0A7J6VB10_THATH|nr:F-box protein [Thalictrum thalictroides]